MDNLTYEVETIESNTITMYVLLSEDNRICMVTTNRQNEEQFEFAFPSDFNFSDIINWKIVNDKLVYDELPKVEPIPQMSLEDRISDLEVAICELADSLV